MSIDPVLFWNSVALEVHRRDFTPGLQSPGGIEVDGPTRTSRAFAMVHLAMHDAWRSLKPNVQGAAIQTVPSLSGLGASPSTSASAEAATGWAAAGVLRALWPGQSAFINAKQADFMAALNQQLVPPTPADIAAGAAFGDMVAAAMLASRAKDGADDGTQYTAPPIAGLHRPDPYAPNQGFLTPGWGNVTPFGPGGIPPFLPPLGSPEPGGFLSHPKWVKEMDEVRIYGAAPGYKDEVRTAEQAVIGIFWGYDGAVGLGTPPRLYNQCLRTISEKLGLGANENAILFARANAAMADAGIAAWAEKYKFNVWRPVIGVREGKGVGYGPFSSSPSPITFQSTVLPSPPPTTEAALDLWLRIVPSHPSTLQGYAEPTHCDPLWKPFGAPRTNQPGVFHRTPGFPAYPSGHATFGAACFGIARHFLLQTGRSAEAVDALEFDFVSDEFDGKSLDPDGSTRTRHVRRSTLAQAIHENAVSRIYIGVHWRMDAVEGVRLGTCIADDRAKMLSRDVTLPDAAIQAQPADAADSGNS